MNDTPNTLTLFRPVGLAELRLIHATGMRRFPPRLPEQPIFYPVLNRPYATQIARDWNAESESDRIGFVLKFDVEASYAAKFPKQIVGGREHEELWVPAEDLEDFNRNIVGPIEILEVFRGAGCVLQIDDTWKLPKSWLNASRQDPITNPKTISEGKYLRLARVGRWEYAERVQASGVVAILAVTDENKLILIEQFRPAVGKTVVEIPAGLCGDQDAVESLRDAAVRELFEETGYKAGRWERLFEGPSSAGLTSESVTFYLAQDLISHGAGTGGGTEEITVHEIPVQKVELWLAGRIDAGHVIDCRVYTALFLARKALGL